MRPVPGSYTIVIVGRWNPFIFTPEWIKANLSHTDAELEAKVKLLLPLNNPDAPAQLQFDGIQLFPSTSRLEIRAEQLTKTAIIRCGDIAGKCLQLLSHTPISALGVNFSFRETLHPEAISVSVSFDDAVNIDSNRFKLINSDVTRNFTLVDEQTELNLKLNIGEPTLIIFNFDIKTSDTNIALQNLTEDKIANYYDTAINFAGTVYNLELEDEAGDHE